MAYMIRTGFLSPGLLPAGEDGEARIARLTFPGHFPPYTDEEGALVRCDIRGQTFRTIMTTVQYMKEFYNSRGISSKPYKSLAISVPPIRYSMRPPGTLLSSTMSDEGSPRSVLSRPRPYHIGDDLPISAPEVGGLSFMWSQADALTKSIAQQLTALEAEYTSGTGTDNAAMRQMVGKLINHFRKEVKVTEQVRIPCCRSFNLTSLGTIPIYQDAVVTLRVRINFWLKMWNEHQEHRRRNSRIDNKDIDKDKEVHQEKGKGKDKRIADRVQHLRDWLAEIDKLPPYPESFPMHPSINPDQHVDFRPSRLPVPKPQAYTGPFQTLDDLTKLNEGQSYNILDHRTQARKDTDRHRRQNYVVSGPGPGASLISEGIRRERATQDGTSKDIGSAGADK